MEFSALAGLTLEKFVEERETIKITASGRDFIMQHHQDCCESVVVESISGDPQAAIGEVIIDATEHSNSDEPKQSDYDESFTWTYYTIRTQSQTIVIRWYGTSNGYYSERVDFEEVCK
jgi:hypothetical protein